MKFDQLLLPPLATIENALFGVSPGLMDAVRRGETSERIAEAVKNSEAWSRMASPPPVEELESALTETTTTDEIPLSIAHLIKQRVRANTQFGSEDAPPAAGQIVMARQIRTPRPGQIDAVMQVPLYVLLDAPAESPDTWHGWLVSGETDYASWWDFVLQETDMPFDPEASMVQVWNPVRIYLPMIDRLAGRLQPARLQAVRALAAEYLTNATPSQAPVWPGHVAQRETLHGLSVVTGSPLGDEDDPRHRYQHLYFHAADAIKLPARLALAAHAQQQVEQIHGQSLLDRLLEQASEMGAALLRSPRMAVPMSESAADDDLAWGTYARIRFEVLESDGAGCVRITATGTCAITAEIWADQTLEKRLVLAPGQEPVQLCWEAQPSTKLVLRSDADESIELTLIP